MALENTQLEHLGPHGKGHLSTDTQYHLASQHSINSEIKTHLPTS